MQAAGQDHGAGVQINPTREIEVAVLNPEEVVLEMVLLTKEDPNQGKGIHHLVRRNPILMKDQKRKARRRIDHLQEVKVHHPPAGPNLSQGRRQRRGILDPNLQSQSKEEANLEMIKQERIKRRRNLKRSHDQARGEEIQDQEVQAVIQRGKGPLPEIEDVHALKAKDPSLAKEGPGLLTGEVDPETGGQSPKTEEDPVPGQERTDQNQEIGKSRKRYHDLDQSPVPGQERTDQNQETGRSPRKYLDLAQSLPKAKRNPRDQIVETIQTRCLCSVLSIELLLLYYSFIVKYSQGQISF